MPRRNFGLPAARKSAAIPEYELASIFFMLVLLFVPAAIFLSIVVGWLLLID